MPLCFDRGKKRKEKKSHTKMKSLTPKHRIPFWMGQRLKLPVISRVNSGSRFKKSTSNVRSPLIFFFSTATLEVIRGFRCFHMESHWTDRPARACGEPKLLSSEKIRADTAAHLSPPGDRKSNPPGPGLGDREMGLGEPGCGRSTGSSGAAAAWGWRGRAGGQRPSRRHKPPRPQTASRRRGVASGSLRPG